MMSCLIDVVVLHHDQRDLRRSLLCAVCAARVVDPAASVTPQFALLLRLDWTCMNVRWNAVGDVDSCVMRAWTYFSRGLTRHSVTLHAP